MTPEIPYEELTHYIETETGCPVTGLYFGFHDEGVENLMPIACEADTVAFFNIIHSYGILEVYVDHFTLDLTDYVHQPPKDDDNQDDRNQDGEFDDEGDSEDEAYEPESESDAESVASLDHLSEGEDELREVRRGNPIAKIPSHKQLPDLGTRRESAGLKSQVFNEHDEYMKDLVTLLTAKDNEDPLKPPADKGSAPATQSSPPVSPRRFGVTKGGFKFGITSMDDAAAKQSQKPVMLRANARVGFGNTMNWLSSGVGSSGMVIREQPRIITMDESISMSAPRRITDPVVGTQESVNASKQKKAKKIEVKRRNPSERVLRQRLQKHVKGPRESPNHAMVVE